MDFTVKAIFIIIFLFLAAFVIGCPIAVKLNREMASVKLLTVIGAISTGCFIMLLSFYILALIMIKQKIGFDTLASVWRGLVLLIGGASILIGIRQWKDFFKGLFKKVLSDEHISESQKAEKPYVFLTLAIIAGILVQMYFSSVTTFHSPQAVIDFSYAVEAAEQNTLFQINPINGERFLPEENNIKSPESPLVLFWAVMGKQLDVHPAKAAGVMGPLFIIPLSYMVFMCLGTALFKGHKRDMQLFVLLICILNFYGRQSWRMEEYFLLHSSWSGGAILVHVLLPFCFYLAVICFNRWDVIRQEHRRAKEALKAVQTNTSSGFFEEDDENMGKLSKVLNVRTLSILLLVLIVIFAGMIWKLNNKINSVFQIAKNAHDTVEEQGKIQQLKQDDKTIGYAISYPEGGLTIVDGGDNSNEEYLSEFINSNGGSVSKWVITSKDQEHAGALYSILTAEEGIVIESVYYMDAGTWLENPVKELEKTAKPK